MEKHSPTDDAPRSDEQQEHERDAERLMLQQEAEHLAHAKYRADSEAGLDRRRVAVPDLASTGARRALAGRSVALAASLRRRARCDGGAGRADCNSSATALIS